MEIAETGRVVSARISGRIARYHIQLARGDKVAIELSISFLIEAASSTGSTNDRAVLILFN